MSDARRSRGRTLSTFVAILACIGATIGACTVYHPNGESCLKDSDCLSGVCTDQVCGSPNPTLVGTMYPNDGGGEADGGSSGDDAGTTTPADSGTEEKDASSDGPPATEDSGQRMMIDSGTDSGSASDSSAPVDSSSTDSALPDSGDTSDAGTGEDALLFFAFFGPNERSV
jgi:hypothetical protein